MSDEPAPSLAARRQSAETLRVLQRYKRLVLLGKVQLPWAIARRLVGPDCAYHLYGRTSVATPRRRRQRR